MARIDHDAFIVATMRDGRMTGVRRYHRSEVEVALLFIDAVHASGGSTNVSIINRVDGEQVSDEDAVRLTKRN